MREPCDLLRRGLSSSERALPPLIREGIRKGQLLDGKYEVTRQLGVGGFGEVWQARDVVLGDRFVAVKFLTHTSAPDTEGFVREMRALEALGLPGIVGFRHHFEYQDQLALVMEFCSGGSLSDQFGTERAQPGDDWYGQVVAWFIPVCETLDAVHVRGFVHQDIKPSNILLKANQPVIADFGIANTSAGTRLYSSPAKQLGASVANDSREDIYGLGVTFLEMVLGTHPWEELAGDDLLRAKRQRVVQSDLLVPPWIIEIGLKAIHPDADLRFQTAQEMADALRAKRVPIVVDQAAIKAHRAVLSGEKALKRAAWPAAQKAVDAALRISPGLPSAMLLAGRIKLTLHQPDAAYEILKEVENSSSQHVVGMELGWLYLQRDEVARAIATLSDVVTRDPVNFEAWCLLLEGYWRVGRFDELKRIAQMIVSEKCESLAFENAGLLARIGAGELSAPWLRQALIDGIDNPVARYNVSVAADGPQVLGGTEAMLSKLLFHDYRFGLAAASKCRNTVVIEIGGRKINHDEAVISIGNLAQNTVAIGNRSVSRRHAAIVNMGNEVWIHDLASTRGVDVDGVTIKRRAVLLGVHDVRLGDVRLKVRASESLVA